MYTQILSADRDLEKEIRDVSLTKLKYTGQKLRSYLLTISTVGFVTLNVDEDSTPPDIPKNLTFFPYERVLYIRGNILSYGTIMPGSSNTRHVNVMDNTLYLE